MKQLIAIALPALLAACGGRAASDDFAALQQRGEIGMGVSQNRSTHHFDSLPDGGRIDYRSDSGDPAEVSQIRAHLQQIAAAFGAGDFTTPRFVHSREVPGTRVMAARRDAITYTYREVPGGGEVRLTTADPEVLAAIHAFMAFQRQDHRAGGAVHSH